MTKPFWGTLAAIIAFGLGCVAIITLATERTTRRRDLDGTTLGPATRVEISSVAPPPLPPPTARPVRAPEARRAVGTSGIESHAEPPREDTVSRPEESGAPRGVSLWRGPPGSEP